MMKRGVLLINLGSPDSASVPDVRKYLREFLMDPRVLDTPWPIRWYVVNRCILPTRPAESVAAYAKIWTKEGSPLVASGWKVRAELQRRLGEELPVELAMRYQNPGIESALRQLRAKGVEDLLVFPLFPQFAMSSFETAVVRAKELAAQVAPGMRLRIAAPFYNDPEYIAALAASAVDGLQKNYDHVLFTFHGLPERHLRKSDPTGTHCLCSADCCEKSSVAHATCYRAQCFATVRALVEQAKIPAGKFSVSFQSRLGSDPWLRPYTDEELVRLPKNGVKRLMVMSPAFVADCLETLEEIAMRGRETFLEAGGEEFTFIPCLNEHPRWLDALEKIVGRYWAEAR
ncbi:MAG: ferrochelatase [Methylacidiphilales bacterium]|nr:ferrochelatase [Candidatus Methylacidiphilales bacterium]